MRSLPKALDYRETDSVPSTLQRLATWARDVITALRQVPDVRYVTVSVPSGGELAVTVGFAPTSVTVARVVSGTVAAAPGVAWVPAADGFRVTAVHGVTGTAGLVLRVEVL